MISERGETFLRALQEGYSRATKFEDAVCGLPEAWALPVGAMRWAGSGPAVPPHGQALSRLLDGSPESRPIGAMSQSPTVPIVRLPHAEGLPLPAYETAQAAGMDMRAAVPEEAPLTLKPGARCAVPTGLAFALPAGFEAQVRPRSGLALKSGVTVLNTPGTVDADYRGEGKGILINLREEDFTIRRGDRIAQLVVAPVVQSVWREVGSLDETARGAGGFGSTGAQ